MKVLISILSIVGFYLFYWIGKSIFYSFLDHDTTYEFVRKGEWIIAGVVGVIICVILTNIDELLTPGIVFISTWVAIFIPFSLGFIILYNITIIGSVLYSIWGYNYIKS